VAVHSRQQRHPGCIRATATNPLSAGGLMDTNGSEHPLRLRAADTFGDQNRRDRLDYRDQCLDYGTLTTVHRPA
jgi:hypothetical protein